MDAQSLLSALFQANPAGSTQNRINHALGPQGLGGGASPLAGLFGGLAQQAGTLFNTGRERVQSGDPLAMGGLGALAGLVLGGRGGAVGGGALALLGSLAYSALKKSGRLGGPAASFPVPPEEVAREAPLGLRAPRTPAEQQELETTAQLIIRAMVNAAKADGHIDGAEMGRLMGKLKEAAVDRDGQDFLLSELQKPFDLEGLIRDVKTPETAAEVYAASVLAIEVDTPAERDYLRQLAAGLSLPPEVVQEIHSAVGVEL